MPIIFCNYSEKDLELIQLNNDLNMLKNFKKDKNKKLKKENIKLIKDDYKIDLNEYTIYFTKKEIKKVKKNINNRMNPYYNHKERIRNFIEINTCVDEWF